MSAVCLVLSTVGSHEEALRIGAALVERRLAACVNVVPGITSIYRWEGEVRSQAEWLLLIKTRRDRFDELREAIHELHSYEVPEIVMIDEAKVDPEYGKWVEECTWPRSE